jgi:hypothetical protein
VALLPTVCFALRYLLNHQTEKHTDEMFYSNKQNITLTRWTPLSALNLLAY